MCGLYFSGLGTPKNTVEAKKWCQASAEKGHKEAAYNLGLMYFNGEGTGQNYVQARYWFELAAKKGHKDAEYNLLKIYSANRAAETKIANQELLEKSAIQARLDAQKIANKPQLSTPAIPAASPAPIAPISRAAPTQPLPAFPPLPSASTARAPITTPAQPTLPSQPVAAPKPLKPVALTAEAQAKYVKEKSCLEAVQKGIIPDNCFAEETPAQQVADATQLQDISWLTQQADNGNVLAMNNLGVMYRRGNNVAKDSLKAFQLFEKAAQKGSANGMVNLASMYKEGDGITRDLEKAYAWYNLAADRSNIAEQQKSARQNVKEISSSLSNEQIGRALEYVNKLDEITPIIQ